MKIITLLLFVCSFQLSARSYSQGITLSLNNVSLSVAFTEIQQQSSFHFVYTSEQLTGASKISLNVKDATLDKVLELCFKDQPLAYSIEEKFIIVIQRDKKGLTSPLIENGIRGKVFNEKNEAIAAATVIIKGTQQGTSTDKKGEFILENVVPGNIIVISSIGYESREILIGNNRVLNILLTIAVSGLDELVVKGYYATSKRLNTGSVGKISAAEIEKQPVSNPLAAMEGRISGLFITQNTGVPGGDFTVRLRGQNSIASGNDPFYLIDGVPFTSQTLSAGQLSSSITQQGNPLSIINPADIESIEVLKDADATAIYGSRGANGVILITTKKGKAGKTKFEINLQQGIGKMTRRLHLLDTRQYLNVRNTAFANDGATPDPGADFDLLVWDTTRNTDWQKQLLGGTAQTTDAGVSVSGGNQHTQFIFSGSYNRQSTVFPSSSKYQKATGHFGLTHSSADNKFKFFLSSDYAADGNNLPQLDLTLSAITLPPDAPSLFDLNNKLNWQNSTFQNPLSFLLQKYIGNTNNFITNGVMSYQVFPSTELKVNAGYSKMDMNEINTLPIDSWLPAFGVTTGQAYFSTGSLKTWIAEPQISWAKKTTTWETNVMAGATLQENTRDRQTYYAYGFTNDAQLENIAAASTVRTTESEFTQYKYNALFGRLSFDWDKKYIFNVTGRRDGSSRFGPGKRFANFGAVGAAWIFSKEKFIMQKLPFISFGKFRMSYGLTGNDQIADYGYLDTYTPAPFPYQGNAAVYPTGLFNADYGWETNKKLEAGLELGLFHDRLLFSLDYYNNRSSNQLVGLPLAPTTGFNIVQFNLPATVQNTGLEMEIESSIIRTKHFTWSSEFTITIPRNKLLSYPNLEGSPYARIYEVGKSLFIQRKLHVEGVDSKTGLYDIQDVNGNGNSFDIPDDLQSLKQVSQQYYGGLNNNLHFKNWDVSMFIQFVKQTGFNYLYGGVFAMPGTLGNQPSLVLNNWKAPGDIAGSQVLSQSYGSLAYQSYSTVDVYGDNVIGDASYVRLKNLSVSYSLPAKWFQKLKSIQCRVFIKGQNLLTFTNYQGLDPENNGANRLPPLKTTVAGLVITL